MEIEQYKLACARRIAQNNLLWQTPTLASAAQAFLFSTAIGSQAKGFMSVLLAVFSAAVGVASLQLMLRHQRLERLDSERLRQFEVEFSAKGYSVIHGEIIDTPVPKSWPERPIVWLGNQKSSNVWIAVLVGFIALGAIVAIRALCTIST